MLKINMATKSYLEQSLDYIVCKSWCNSGACTCGAEELIQNIKKQLANQKSSMGSIWFSDEPDWTWNGTIPDRIDS